MEGRIFAILFIFSTVFCLPELEYVNVLRARHNAPPVQYNLTLARNSNQWAFYLNSIKALIHSEGLIVGENLGIAQFDSNTTKSIIKLWYDENTLYNYADPGFTYQTGHFTQLVWKDTKSIGFGIALDVNTNYLYMVMQFYPPGNVQGGFQNNVFPTKEKGTTNFTCKCKC